MATSLSPSTNNWQPLRSHFFLVLCITDSQARCTSSTVPSGYFEMEVGTFYRLTDTTDTWGNGYNVCQGEGAQMAVAKTEWHIAAMEIIRGERGQLRNVLEMGLS